jgi:D-alanyl-D-alanine carboxypeptidase
MPWILSRRRLLADSFRASAGLGLSALPVAPRPRPTAAAAVDKIDAFVDEQMTKYRIPGLSLAVVREGRVVKERAYGKASLELDVAVTTSTVYQLASVSKIFAGTAAMLLVEEGRLALDTSIVDFMPSLPKDWRPVRLHHVLEHTSGLPRGLSESPAFQAEQARRKAAEKFADEARLDYFTAEEQLAYVAEQPIVSPPGERFSYSYTGYLLAGVLIERVSGLKYAELLQRRVFGPLGMTSCAFGDSRVVVPNRIACAYTRQYGGVLQNWAWQYSANGYAAAGLNASATDVARFVIALEAGHLLKRESVERMWTPAALNDGSTHPYGLGWSIGSLDGKKTVGHEGGGCCWVTHVPDARLCVVALSNMAGARADDTADQIARLVLGG